MSGHSKGPFRADPRERDIVILDANGREVCRLQEPTRFRPAPDTRTRQANAWLVLLSPAFLAGSRILLDVASRSGSLLLPNEVAELAAVREAVDAYDKEVG